MSHDQALLGHAMLAERERRHSYRGCDFNNPQAVCQKCGKPATGNQTFETCSGSRDMEVDG